MENNMELPQKTKNRITIWSSNPVPGHISVQTYNLERYMHPDVHSSTVHQNPSSVRGAQGTAKNQWVPAFARAQGSIFGIWGGRWAMGSLVSASPPTGSVTWTEAHGATPTVPVCAWHSAPGACGCILSRTTADRHESLWRSQSMLCLYTVGSSVW